MIGQSPMASVVLEADVQHVLSRRNGLQGDVLRRRDNWSLAHTDQYPRAETRVLIEEVFATLDVLGMHRHRGDHTEAIEQEAFHVGHWFVRTLNCTGSIVPGSTTVGALMPKRDGIPGRPLSLYGSGPANIPQSTPPTPAPMAGDPGANCHAASPVPPMNTVLMSTFTWFPFVAGTSLFLKRLLLNALFVPGITGQSKMLFDTEKFCSPRKPLDVYENTLFLISPLVTPPLVEIKSNRQLETRQ